MRRRTDPTATAPQNPTTPLQPGTHDWVSPPPAGEAALQAARVPDLRRQAERTAANGEKVVPAGGHAGNAAALDEGDVLTVTMGKEVIYPVKYNGFEVGPLSMTVTVRKGETAASAYDRARGVLEQLYETELDLQLKQFVEHLDKARAQVRGE